MFDAFVWNGYSWLMVPGPFHNRASARAAGLKHADNSVSPKFMVRDRSTGDTFTEMV